MAKKLREPEAINNMGLMYEGGFDATISDPDRAKEHYELAHKLGNTDASMNLALMYLNNMYMDTDIQYAVYLLKGAARNGNVKAKDYLLANGYITDISEIEKENNQSFVDHDELNARSVMSTAVKKQPIEEGSQSVTSS